jgi:aminopeptidase N
MLLLAIVLQSGVLAPANTPRPAHDALHYGITLRLADRDRQIEAEVASRFHLLSARPLTLELDSVLRVNRVRVDDKAVTSWTREGDVITIPHSGSRGDTVTVTIEYAGSPRDGLILRDSAGQYTIFADNWPNRAHRWFPSQDHPSDKATVTFEIQGPVGYTVVANGDPSPPLQPRQRGTIWKFEMARPIPVYTMVIGVAKLARASLGQGGCVVRCVPVEVLTYPEDSVYAVDGPFKRAAEMIDFFTSVVGEFPYSRLTHVQSSTIFGGMENSTIIFYDEGAYRKRNLGESTVAHETAHQWFGDAVTEREWSHLWLSEGFATYFAALWAEHKGGDSALQATMGSAARGIFGSQSTNRPIIDSAENLLDLLNTNNYNKGSWVLHSLRGLIGDSAFFGGIRQYYARYRDSTVLSSDFQHIMETASGQDLSWYFAQALNQPGYPKLEITPRFDRKKALVLTIRQTQAEGWGVYRLPGFELLIDGLLVRVDLEEQESTFTFDQFTSQPKSIEVDPNRWWLIESRVKGEE